MHQSIPALLPGSPSYPTQRISASRLMTQLASNTNDNSGTLIYDPYSFLSSNSLLSEINDNSTGDPSTPTSGRLIINREGWTTLEITPTSEASSGTFVYQLFGFEWLDIGTVNEMRRAANLPLSSAVQIPRGSGIVLGPAQNLSWAQGTSAVTSEILSDSTRQNLLHPTRAGAFNPRVPVLDYSTGTTIYAGVPTTFDLNGLYAFAVTQSSAPAGAISRYYGRFY